MGVAAAASALGALLAGAAAAQAQPPPGGRPAALGRAYSALAGDAYAPLWNPAGTALLARPQAAWLYDAGSGQPRHAASLAVPLSASHGGGLSAEAGDGRRSYGLSYGRALGAAALGVSARSVEEEEGRGGAFDAGLLYRFDRRLTAAFVAAALGRRAETRLAAGYAVDRRLAYALESVFARGDRGGGLRTGLELTGGPLRARLGVDTTLPHSSLLGLTAGLGLGWGEHTLDLAYIPQGSRSIHQLTLVMALGRAPRRLSVVESVPSAAEPARSSPTAVDSVSFRLDPSTAPFSGFLANPEDPDWAKPKQPVIPEKPVLEEPVQPGLIWLQ